MPRPNDVKCSSRAKTTTRMATGIMMFGMLVSPIRSVGQSCQEAGNSAIRSVWINPSAMPR